MSVQCPVVTEVNNKSSLPLVPFAFSLIRNRLSGSHATEGVA